MTVILCLVCVLPAAAEENYFAYSLDELMGIEVVTASRYSQDPQDVPANITIITSKEIRRKGYRTLLEVFRDVPVMDIVSAGQGYFTDIGGRGVNQRATMGKHWQILIDGHDMAWTQFNRNHMTDAWVSLDNIERIEIVRGSASAVWGANAYLGVINIITRSVHDIENGDASFGISDNHFFSGHATAGGRIGKDGSLITTVSMVHEDRSLKVKEWSRVAGEDVFLRGNDSEFINWYTKAGYGDFFLNFMLSEDDSKHAISSFAIGADHARFHISKYFVDLGWDHEFNNGSSLKVTCYYDRMEWGDKAQYEDNPFNGPLAADTGNNASRAHFIRKMDGADDIYGVNINATVRLHDDLDILLGAEYEMQDIKRWSFPAVLAYYDLAKPKYHIYESGVYSQLSYRPTDKLHLVGGVRYDYNEVYKEEVSPRAAILIKPTECLTWKIMYGQAYKEPSLHELYYYRANAVYGNPTIDPEKNETYETQLMFACKESVYLSLGLFYIDMKDMITYQTRDAGLPLEGEDEFPESQRPTGSRNYRQQRNEGRFTTSGVEAGLRYHPTDSLILTLDGIYQDAVDESDDERLAYTPQYKAVASLTYNVRNKHSFCLSSRYVGTADSTTYLFTEPGYDNNMTVDLTPGTSAYIVSSLAFTTHDIVEDVDLLIRFENITDKEYYDPGRHVNYHQPEFNLFAKLTYRF